MTLPREISREEGVLAGTGGTLHFHAVRTPGEPWARLGILHGYGEHGGRYLELMEWLAGAGVESAALDFRGHGRSGGRRGAVLRWEEYLDDVEVFLDHLSGPGDPEVPLFLLGHSHGGLVLLAAALRGLGGVSGFILSAPYLRRRVEVPLYKDLAGRLLSRFLPALTIATGLRPEWMTSDEVMIREAAEDRLMLRSASTRWYVTSHQAQAELVRRAREVTQPLLVLTGDADPIADPRGAHDFFLEAGSQDKEFRIYPGLLHEILREQGRRMVFGHILSWMQTHAASSSARSTVPN